MDTQSVSSQPQQNSVNHCECAGCRYAADYAIKTGVSAYNVCYEHFREWLKSDQTKQALDEILGRKAVS